MIKAMDIMSGEVLTVSPEMSVNDLAKFFYDHNISGAPVVSVDGVLLGVVTQSDLIDQNKKVHIPTVITILDSFFYLESPEKMEAEIKKIAGTCVADIYTKDAVTISIDTGLDEIATIMAESNVHTIPVMDGEKIAGIVGRRDILKTLYS